MTILSKLKWFIGIFMVFFLIVATNLIDKKSFTRIKESVVSIYEDRLVAKKIIYDISNKIHQKELAIALNDSMFYQNENSSINEGIDELLLQFGETNLTKQEKFVLDQFKMNFIELKKLEKSFSISNLELSNNINLKIEKITDNLNALSVIQMEEGKKHMFISKKELNTVEIFTQMEIILLFILALIVQVIIMYKPKSK